MSNNWPIERERRLRELFDQGLTGTQMASELGLSRNAVQGKLDRMGLKRGRDKVTRVLEQKARRIRKRTEPSPQKVPKSRQQVMDDLFATLDAMKVTGSPKGVPLADLGDKGCRWIAGEPTHNALWCGEPVFEDDSTLVNGRPVRHPYCPAHCAIAYRRKPTEAELARMRESAAVMRRAKMKKAA